MRIEFEDGWYTFYSLIYSDGVKYMGATFRVKDGQGMVDRLACLEDMGVNHAEHNGRFIMQNVIQITYETSQTNISNWIKDHIKTLNRKGWPKEAA